MKPKFSLLSSTGEVLATLVIGKTAAGVTPGFKVQRVPINKAVQRVIGWGSPHVSECASGPNYLALYIIVTGYHWH
jgi:hypothetical protein